MKRRCKDCKNLKMLAYNDIHRFRYFNFGKYVVGWCNLLRCYIDNTGNEEYYKCNAYTRKRWKFWRSK